MHLVEHVFYRVNSTHYGSVATIVVKELDFVFLVHVVVYRVHVLVEASKQLLVHLAALNLVGKEIIEDFAVGIYPAWTITPLGIKVALHHTHLLTHRLLGIALHAGVDGGVNFETIAIEINVVVFAPVAHFLHQCHLEIGTLVVLLSLRGVLYVEVLLAQAVIFFLVYITMSKSIVKHSVATLKATLGMLEGVVIGRAL